MSAVRAGLALGQQAAYSAAMSGPQSTIRLSDERARQRRRAQRRVLPSVYSGPVGSNSLRRRNSTGIKYLLAALPFLAFVFAFQYVPIFGWLYAFFEYRPGMALSDMEFVGLSNFAKLFVQRRETLRVLRNTLVMSGLGIVASPLPALFAIMINEIGSSKYRRFIQTTTTLPNFISWIIVFGLSFAMFSSGGFLARFQELLGLPVPPIGLLGNNAAVWPFHLGLAVWKSLGWSAIIYLAAISGIDQELYDAAEVDGANRIGKIIHITIPGIMPTYLVLLLLAVSNLLTNGFDQFFAFHNPLVADRIEVLDYYVYKIGILIGDYSYSIAIGIMKTLISIVLLFSVNAITKLVRGTSLV